MIILLLYLSEGIITFKDNKLNIAKYDISENRELIFFDSHDNPFIIFINKNLEMKKILYIIIASISIQMIYAQHSISYIENELKSYKQKK